MDTLLEGLPGSVNRFRFDHDSTLGYSNQNLAHEFKVEHEFNGSHFPPDDLEIPCDSSSSPSSGSSSSDADYPENSQDFSTAVLKYINEMLMEEEDLEVKPCMLQDCLALQAAEKSLYEVIGQNYPSSFNQSLSVCSSKRVDSEGGFDQHEFESSFIQNSLTDSPPVDSLLVSDSFSETNYLDHFNEGIKEARKFLPNRKVEIIDLESSTPLKVDERYKSKSISKGKKNHHREDGDADQQGRSNKHSAVSPDSYEPQEMFDKVLLCQNGHPDLESCADDNDKIGEKGKLLTKGSSGKKSRQKKLEVVDLWTLLNHCAQAVANYDQKTANQLLQQIKQHSSPYGDGTQRLAHYFANGLEVRLVGGSPLYMTYVSNGTSAADILKAYHAYITACPFKRMSNIFANRTIAKLAAKARRLHIIDFGILYGYQWPCLIQGLSVRSGGPPMLRVTGIEFPQPGFRPSERVEETGRRLANYCKRFNVPFEYHVIAKKWETIRYEDLKIDRDEFIAVNCIYRMRHIPDETVLEDSPRDTVLKLIKRINPDIFIHGVVNGTYNTPFFLTRFREALYHFSALFDMFEASLSTEDQDRLRFEKEVFGKNVMNAIACEGLQRVERPETYKQWQVRNVRAGLKQVPLDREIVKKVKNMVRSEYHKDFVVDEDGMWMLQGWKGRIIKAISCWKAA
ncbi:hypothetical protein FEM48_Zijuj02G0072900 [Ziziphus jujuba var. spinosa]|uniref:Scarecrow-like protein 30 n=1 Tax=Ziziphus jujuba var. spinosa TaxID=714518 RepID=A0A978VUD6_ZIZJJ|nr:hypothetical protein FEM48_Zijuj02G0072900 [Ziziphus jujuba var. spinosa]